MKKLFFTAAMLVVCVVANAKVWRVNPNEAAKADFLSVTDACAANKVHEFDTLYIEPGTYPSYQDVTKSRLTLLGPGWEIPANFGSTSSIATAYFSESLRVSADTITLCGLQVREIVITSSLRDLTVERCRLGRIGKSNIGYTNTIKNITIRNNFFTSALYESAPIMLEDIGSILNVSIENNILVNYSNPADQGDYGAMITLRAYYEANTSGLIAHNTLITKQGWQSYPTAINARQTVIRDNIIINKSTYSDYSKYLILYDRISTCEFYNNVLSWTEENAPADMLAHFPNNRYVGATTANTFTQTIINNAEETAFQLKDDSPAKNSAYMGEDCGAFAGSWPFVVQGRPIGIPYIYDVVAPSYPTNDQLNISFKVKANNQ